MNFSNEIIKLLDDLGKRLGVAIDWTSENVLPYVQDLCGRFIKYEIVTHSIGLLCCILYIIGFILFIKNIVGCRAKCIRSREDNFWWEYWDSRGNCDMTCGGIILTVFGVVFLLASIITIFCLGDCIVKCIFLPELKIIEYLKLLV